MLKNPREIGKLAARSQSRPDVLHKPGDQLDQTTTFGSMSSMKAANKVKSQIKPAVANGAKAVEIGPEIPADSAFVRPPLMHDVTADNPIFQ